jgi:hypothetical protein
VAVIVIALGGAWLFWSLYANLAAVSWWYDHTQSSRSRTKLPNPDYELATLPWKLAHPRAFDLQPEKLTIVTDREPFSYQAYATISTHGASAAAIEFDAELEAGGATIGLLQSGKWIAVNSSQTPGIFAQSNAAQLGYGRSLTVMIANDNSAGESRLTVKSLRLYLRR